MGDRDAPVLLFDIGGVFVEWAGPAGLMALFPDDVAAPEVWRRWLTSPAVRAFESGRIDADAFAEGIIAEMGLAVTPGRFLREFGTWTIGVYPEAMEALGRIPRSYHRSVLSNSNELYWPEVARLVSLATNFDSSFVSHLMGMLKPDSEVFAHVAAELGRAPSEIAFFDDNAINVEAAEKAGYRAYLVGPSDLGPRLVQLGIIPG